MKKTFRLILALVLALMMLLTSVSVFADESDPQSLTEPVVNEEENLPVGNVYADDTITVLGLAEGDVAHFYKILEWDGETANNWKFTENFESLTEADYLAITGQKKVEGKYVYDDTITSTERITAELAGRIAKIAGALKDTEYQSVTAEKDTTGNGYHASLTVTGDEGSGSGLYVALVTPADPDTIYSPVFVSSDYKGDNTTDKWTVTELASYEDKAAAKKSTVTLNKTANTTEDAWDDAEEIAKQKYHWSTTAIGDTVNFTVTTTIPGYGKVYNAPFFKVSDKLTDLKLVAGSIELSGVPAKFVKDEETLDSYTISPAEDLKSYTVTFNSDFLTTLNVPTNITITYKAIVDTTAPLSVNKEKNEVSTEFSHDVTDESDHKFKKDTTNHYTFTLDADILGNAESEKGKRTSELVKIGVGPDGEPIIDTVVKSAITETNTWTGPLEGAVFGLFTDAEAKNAYVPKKADGTAGSTALTATTTADGRMTFPGLDAGTYYLKEISAPEGFVRNTSIYMIVIEAKTKEVELTEYTQDGITWIDAEALAKLSEEEQAKYKSYTYTTDVLDTYTVKIGPDADHLEDTATYHFKNDGNDVEVEWEEDPPVELPFDITNVRGVELPSTGGIGTTLFYVGGSILVLAAVILLVTKRRMGGND